MAARRLLIVMLILLGLSTLAAALVPQHTLRGDTTTATTATRPTQTTPIPAPAYVPPTKIAVGGKKFPIVFPLHVGEQLTLLVYSRRPTELEIPAFGLVAFAAPSAPARFALLPNAPGTYGILFSPSGKVAAQIRVVAPGSKSKGKRKARSRARGGSARP